MSSPYYTPEAKARAIAALLVGERPRVVAREHGIPESTVTTWRHRLKHGKLRHKKRDGAPTPLGEQIESFLDSSLRSLIEQNRVLSDHEWIHKQGAGAMAVLSGTLVDRAIRILELLPALLDEDALRRAGWKG